MWGAASVKPTSLLLNDCRAARGFRARCAHARGHQALVGIDSSGNFVTTAAARYPAPLCAALARAMWLRLRP
eukprot:6922731-Lingulodinium_polyedra.AAC.1